jgi:hypothetical protein
MRVLLFVLLAPSFCWAQTDHTLNYSTHINAENIKQHLSILASDSFEGRETAMKGQKLAADYIENSFKMSGLKPGNGTSYQQYFDVMTTQTDGSIIYKGKDYPFLSNFYFYAAFRDTSMQPDIVFLGQGKKTDFQSVDVKGKAILISDAEIGKYKTIGYDWKARAKIAEAAGASCVLVITPNFEDKMKILEYYLSFGSMRLPGGENPDYERKKMPKIPYIFINEELGLSLLKDGGVSTKNIHKTKIGHALGNPLHIKIMGGDKRLQTSNVIGVIPGTDLAHEYVIITAHYDHLGKKGNLIFNGADDDGSGTSTLLTIAQAFAEAMKDGNAPRRTVVFMTVSGEEKGLLGSEYYVTNPIYPLQNTVVDLNVDMIGRIDSLHAPDSNYVYLIGSDRLSTDLHRMSEETNAKYTQLTLDYTYNDPNDPNQFYYRSDHYNFASNNIPVIFYFTGVHEDYHQASDTWDKIMYQKTARIGQLIFFTAWNIANADKRPEVNVKN